MSQPVNHGMLQQSNNSQQQHVNNVVNYPSSNSVPNSTFQSGHHVHGHGSEGLVGTSDESPHVLNSNVPGATSGSSSVPSPWTANKSSPPLHQGSHGMMTPGDVHQHLRSNSSSYGAPSPFNNNTTHFQQQSQQQQQHCLYSQQQHNMELRYESPTMRPSSASDYSANVEMPNANPVSGYYHHHDEDDPSARVDCRQQQYYGSTMDHQQGFPSYDQHQQHHGHHHDMKSGSVAVGNASSSCAMMGTSGGGHSNFYPHHGYGYNNQRSQHYHHHEMYQGNEAGDDFAANNNGPSRTAHPVSTIGGGNMNNVNHRYFDQNHHHHRPDGYMYNASSSCGYSSSSGNHNGSNCTSSGGGGRYGMMPSSTSVPPPHYNNTSQMHGHHHHPPFRRKSMESYISEPGEIRYNNKYGCISSSSSGNSPAANFPASQQSQYISPAPSPSSSTTTMVKRECLSNPSSSALPVMPTGSPDCSSPWTASRATPNSNDIQMHEQHQQHHDSVYLYPDQNGSSVTMTMTDLEYGNNTPGTTAVPYANAGTNSDAFHHQSQHLPSFKSCAFGGQSECSKMDGDMKGTNNNYGVKAASVKHRSLSLSIPSASSSSSPSPYSQMGQMPSSTQANFPTASNEPHLEGHGESHRSDNSPNSSSSSNGSCCNPMEKVGAVGESHIMSSSSPFDCGLESNSTSGSMSHQQHYVSSYGEVPSSMGGSAADDVSLHVQGSYNHQSDRTRDDCCSVVTSCSSSEQVHNDESNQHSHCHHHNHHHHQPDCYLQQANTEGESLEKVYSTGMVGDGSESQSGSNSSNSSIAGSPPHTHNSSNNNNNDLCSSTPSHCCDEGGMSGGGMVVVDGNTNSITNNDPSASLIPESPEFGRDLSESDMVIVEKSFENDDDEDPPDPEELMLDDDDEIDEEGEEAEESHKTKPLGPSSDSNVISTTTNDLSRFCRNECDESNSNSSTGSNCSFSSALFGIKRANNNHRNRNHGGSNSISCNFNSDSNDNESCGSGGSLTFGSIGRSDSFGSVGNHHHNHHHSSVSGGASSGGGHCGSKLSASPQKISKRSFSETDKDLVLNTTTLSFGAMLNAMEKMNHGRPHTHKSGCGTNNPLNILTTDGGVRVPKGWKREIYQANNENNPIVYYVR
jgi:hypothetical protein